MRIGTPSSSVNCLDGADFFPLELGAEAIRVPRPAAGMMTTTFIEGDQYTAASVAVQIGGLLGRFPKFNAVPLWVHDPGKAAVVVIFAIRIDFDAFFPQRLEEGIEIVDPVVDHEAAAAGIEIFRVTPKYCPYGHSLPLTVVCLPPQIGRAHSELQSPCNLVCRLLLEKKIQLLLYGIWMTDGDVTTFFNHIPKVLHRPRLCSSDHVPCANSDREQCGDVISVHVSLLVY